MLRAVEIFCNNFSVYNSCNQLSMRHQIVDLANQYVGSSGDVR